MLPWWIPWHSSKGNVLTAAEQGARFCQPERAGAVVSIRWQYGKLAPLASRSGSRTRAYSAERVCHQGKLSVANSLPGLLAGQPQTPDRRRSVAASYVPDAASASRKMACFALVSRRFLREGQTQGNDAARSDISSERAARPL